MLSLSSPWLILAAGIGLAGLASGAYVKGRSDGRAVEIAQRVTLEEVARTAREAAQEAAAEAIAKISVTHTTIRQKAEVVTREVPVYRDCANHPDVVGLLDAARANQPPGEPTRDRVVPGAGTSPTPDVR